MILLRYSCLIPVLLLHAAIAHAQTYTAADSAQNEILVQSGGPDIRLGSRLRPLSQIAGAPQAFYSYFWEFGDGSYSTEKEPVHHYSRSGAYTVRLWATNNYDDGKRPPIRSKIIRVADPSGTALAGIGNDAGITEPEQSLVIRHNADPKPDESFVCALGYRVTGASHDPDTARGTLLICYNETSFGNDNFLLEEVRTHHGEQEISADALNTIINKPVQTLLAAAGLQRPGPAGSGESFDQAILRQQLRSMVKETMKNYRNHKIWRTGSAGNSLQHLFLQLHTTPEMIRDTNATVKITTIFIPDNEALNAELAELQMQIVASHDPNKMKVRHNILNYRFINKRRKLRYTIQFQNTGKGPASTIALKTSIPPYLNTATLNVLGYYPRCPTCDAAAPGKSCFSWQTSPDSIVFTFRNVYLPGTQQEGVNDRDSTKGFVSYEINFGKRKAKKAFSSQTAIYFDKNPAVITNHARNFYQPGLSPGIIAGLYTHANAWKEESNPDQYRKWEGRQQLSLGLSIAPYAPSKPYLQGEIYLRRQNQVTQPGTAQDTTGVMALAGGRYELQNYRTDITYSSTSVDVAGLIRYNIKDWITAGAGVMISAKVQETLRSNTVYTFLNVPFTFEEPADLSTGGVSGIAPALILDMGLGKVRAGPSLGFRYLQYFQGPGSRFFLYATWKL